MALVTALVIGAVTLTDAQEKRRPAAEIQADIDKLQTELRESQQAEGIEVYAEERVSVSYPVARDQFGLALNIIQHKLPAVSINIDEGKIHVTATQADHKKVEEILPQLEKIRDTEKIPGIVTKEEEATWGLREVLPNELCTKSVKVEHVDAALLADVLRSLVPMGDIEKETMPPIRVFADPRTNSIIVVCVPGQHRIVEALIQRLDREGVTLPLLQESMAKKTQKEAETAVSPASPLEHGTEIKIFRLANSLAAAAAETLTSMFPQSTEEGKTLFPQIVTDVKTNSITVFGTPHDHKIIGILLRELDVVPVEQRVTVERYVDTVAPNNHPSLSPAVIEGEYVLVSTVRSDQPEMKGMRIGIVYQGNNSFHIMMWRNVKEEDLQMYASLQGNSLVGSKMLVHEGEDGWQNVSLEYRKVGINILGTDLNGSFLIEFYIEDEEKSNTFFARAGDLSEVRKARMVIAAEEAKTAGEEQAAIQYEHSFIGTDGYRVVPALPAASPQYGVVHYPPQ